MPALIDWPGHFRAEVALSIRKSLTPHRARAAVESSFTGQKSIAQLQFVNQRLGPMTQVLLQVLPAMGTFQVSKSEPGPTVGACAHV